MFRGRQSRDIAVNEVECDGIRQDNRETQKELLCMHKRYCKAGNRMTGDFVDRGSNCIYAIEAKSHIKIEPSRFGTSRQFKIRPYMLYL